MLAIEIVLISLTIVLTLLAYFNHTRSSQILKQSRAQYRQIEQLHNSTQQYYLEILRARDKAEREAERIASFWYTERLN